MKSLALSIFALAFASTTHATEICTVAANRAEIRVFIEALGPDRPGCDVTCKTASEGASEGGKSTTTSCERSLTSVHDDRCSPATERLKQNAAGNSEFDCGGNSK
jgi:hypothetical protein